MFDFSFAELALVVVVAVIFIGPKELPVVVRGLARAWRAVAALGAEIRAAMKELGKEAGLDDINDEIRMIRGDDGKLYESYGAPIPPLGDKHE